MVALAGCTMPIQAPPIRAQRQAEQALPFEQAPQTPIERPAPVAVPEVVVMPATDAATANSGYPAKPREVFELDHMVPAVMPTTTNAGYPAKPREVFELDHYGQP
jgi:hypothetical protein